MSRLINAEALKDAHIECPDNISFFDFGEIVERFMQAIDEQPTVDAVPVVRCRECRWACLAPQRQTATCMKNRLPFTHDYYWFCADGERR